MRFRLLFALLLLALLPASAKSTLKYTSLDREHPIKLKGERIIYNKVEYTLDMNTLFLDGRLSDEQAALSPFIFNSAESLAGALASRSDRKNVRLLVAPWVYNVDHLFAYKMELQMEGLSIIGLTEDARNVVFAGFEDKPSNVLISADQLQLEHITIGNFTNTDLTYPLQPSLSRQKKTGATLREPPLLLKGKLLKADGCRFISRQNLGAWVSANYAEMSQCYLESGNDDGSWHATFRQCTFSIFGSHLLRSTRSAGTAFIECTINIHPSAGKIFITQEPSPATLADCRFQAPEGTGIYWSELPDASLRCYLQNTTLNGAPLQMSPTNTVILKSHELLGSRLLVSASADSMRTGSGPITLQASVLSRSGEPDASEQVYWRMAKGSEHYLQLLNAEGPSCQVQAISEDDESKQVCVEAYTKDGLVGAARLTVCPALLPPPTFKEFPTMTVADGVAHISYTLSDEAHADRSQITWYRTKFDGDRNIEIPVSVSRTAPAKDYRLQPGDMGYYLMANIAPATQRSMPGGEVMVMSDDAIGSADVDETNSFDTDFSSFPTAPQSDFLPGCWTLSGTADAQGESWTYGTATGGCRGEGLYPSANDARLVYTPMQGRYGNMLLTIDMDPQQLSGDGFSNTDANQFADIYIKYDPRTATGYGLRIARSAKEAGATEFTLMEYRRGAATPLGASATARCFLSGCTLRLEAAGATLSVSASTGGNGAGSVNLQTAIKPNYYGGVGIRFAGDAAESKIMLHSLHMEWQ